MATTVKATARVLIETNPDYKACQRCGVIREARKESTLCRDCRSVDGTWWGR